MSSSKPRLVTPIAGVALALICLIGLPGRAAADLVYATDAYGANNGIAQDQFGTLDLSTGVFTPIFAPATDSAIFAMGYGTDNQLYGITFEGEVYRISPSLQQVTDLGNVGDSVIGGTSVGGTFYLVSADVQSNLFTFNPVTDATSSPLPMNVAGTSQPFQGDGLVAVGAGDTLYVSGVGGSSFTDSLYTTNTATGAVTLIGDLGTNLFAGLFQGGTLYGIDAANNIWHVDPSTGDLSSVTPIIGFGDGDFLSAVVALQSVPEGNSLVMLAIGALTLGLAGRVPTASRRSRSASCPARHCPPATGS